MKLKYFLRVFGRVLVFAVLDMDERFLGKEWIASVDSKVISMEFPEIEICDDDLRIFLRGADREKDYDPAIAHFKSHTQALTVEARIHSLLRAWASTHGGWDKAKDQGPDTYVLT